LPSDLNVLRRNDSGYEEACRVFNLAGVPAPAEAVIARTVGQVRTAVRYAAGAGRPVRMLTTGHGSLSRGAMDDALLIRVELTDGLRIDPATRTARVPAGTRWGEVVTAAAEFGLTALHPSSPTIGAVGYLLHGGLSFYGRRHGVAANLVRAIELVTATGGHMRVDTAHHPEFFWALRGGGGGFAVVTAVEIELIEVAATLSGSVVWPAEHAATLIPAWRDWAASAPRAITTNLRLLNLPDLPGVPAPLAGRQSVWISGTALASVPAELDTTVRAVRDLIEPLRAIAEPTLNTWRPTSVTEVLRSQTDPESPTPVRSAHRLLEALPDATVETLLDAAGPDSDSPLAVVQLRQLGGAFADPGRRGGAFDRVDAPWLYHAAGVAPDAAAAEAISDQLAANNAVLSAHTTLYTAPSFVEDADQYQRSFDAETARAVNAIRQSYDPDGLFSGDVAATPSRRPSPATTSGIRNPNASAPK
jgi:FAD/FMN-containing dehydrogenase